MMMASTNVYEFEDDDIEIRETDHMANYEKVKKQLGFVWWSLRKEDERIKIIIDGLDLETKIRVISPGYSFGEVKSIERLDHMCVKFSSRSASVILALYDFSKTATELSKLLDNSTMEKFCDGVRNEIQLLDNRSEGTQDVGPSPSKISHQEKSGESGNMGTAAEVVSEKGTQNTLFGEISVHFVGEVQVPITAIVPSSEIRALRTISSLHINKLRKNFTTEYTNGHKVNFPTAVGFIPNAGGVGKEELLLAAKGGNKTVEIIDGNHTHQVMKELNGEYPEEPMFQYRKVRLYGTLDESLVHMLALMANEEACNSMPTPQYNKVKIMRDQLKLKYGGVFCPEYQEHVYRLFNALSPNDIKEETRRKKGLQHFIRISTMADECWEIVEQLAKENPTISMLMFRDLGDLSKEQSVGLLNNLVNKELKPTEFKEKAKSLKAPSNKELTFQRLRGKKKAATLLKEAKKGSSKKKVPKDATTEVSAGEDDCDTVSANASVVEVDEITFIPNSNLEKKLENVQKENGDYKLEIANLRMTINSLKDENTKLEERNASLLQKVEEITATNAQLMKETYALRQEKNQLERASNQKPSHKDVGSSRTLDFPFSVGSSSNSDKTWAPYDKSQDHEQPEQTNAGLVEWNSGKVYLGIFHEREFVFAFKPLGVVTNEKCKDTASSKSFKLNLKDRQEIEKRYIISRFMVSVKDNTIDQLSLPLFQEDIDNYITNTK